MKKHIFDIDLATNVGIEKAIILENLSFWIIKNLHNNKNIYDDNVWTYNTYEAFKEMFPYMKLNTIKRHIRELEDMDILVSRTDLNSNKWDKTKWYAFSENAPLKYLLKDSEIDKLSNVKKITIENKKNNHQELKKQLSYNVSDINTDINTDKESVDTDPQPPISKKISLDELVEQASDDEYIKPKQKVSFKKSHYALALTMYHNLLAINESFKKPDLAKWANEFRLMEEMDGRTLEKMDNFLDLLATSDERMWEFWRGNILSPTSMRRNYDKVVAQYRRDIVNSKKVVDTSIPLNERIKALSSNKR